MVAAVRHQANAGPGLGSRPCAAEHVPAAAQAVNILARFILLEGQEKPQGLGGDYAEVYWQRLLAGLTITAEDSDQEVLVAISRYDVGRLVGYLAKSDEPGKVEQFQSMLSPAGLVTLLLPTCEALIDRERTEATVAPQAGRLDDDQAPGIVPIWRMWLRRARRGNGLDPTLVRSELTRAIGCVGTASVRLLHHVEYYFLADDESGMISLLSRLGMEDAREELRALIASSVRSYETRCFDLARALCSATRGTLLHLLFGRARVAANEIDEPPFDGWEPMAATILAACAIAPGIVAPQLAPFVFDGARSGAVFNASRAERLFGDGARVVDLLARGKELLRPRDAEALERELSQASARGAAADQPGCL